MATSYRIEEEIPWPKSKDPRANEVLEDRIIRIGELAKALRMAYMEGGTKEDCINVAKFIMDFFGFEDYILDNRLDQERRGKQKRK
tara:strand:- start:643 stop:900 length:258 start_codon:yes stop_codon:yes gene_type:complete